MTKQQGEETASLTEETRSFWRELGKQWVRESNTSIDEAAKQLVTITAILEGLYFHAIAFSDLRGQVDQKELIIYVTPIFLFLVSLGAALFIFMPNYHLLNLRSSKAGKEIFTKVTKRKLLLLRISAIFLFLGVLALCYAVITFLNG